MEGFLELVEFSIALAGFTGIVVIFTHQNQKWEALDKFRVINALMSSNGAAFLASIPIGLNYLKLSERMIWEIEALVIMGYLILIFSSIFFRIRKRLTQAQRKQLPKNPIILLTVFGVIIAFFLTTSLSGLIDFELKGLNYFSILFLLLLSVFAFARIIFYRPKS